MTLDEAVKAFEARFDRVISGPPRARAFPDGEYIEFSIGARIFGHARSIQELAEVYKHCNVLVGDPSRPHHAMAPMRYDQDAGKFYAPNGSAVSVRSEHLAQGHLRFATPFEMAEYKHAGGWVAIWPDDLAPVLLPESEDLAIRALFNALKVYADNSDRSGKRILIWRILPETDRAEGYKKGDIDPISLQPRTDDQAPYWKAYARLIIASEAEAVMVKDAAA